MGKQRAVNRLLVTGGAGFIGSAFIRYVLQQVPSFSGRCINLDLLTYAGNLAIRFYKQTSGKANTNLIAFSTYSIVT